MAGIDQEQQAPGLDRAQPLDQLAFAQAGAAGDLAVADAGVVGGEVVIAVVTVAAVAAEEQE